MPEYYLVNPVIGGSLKKQFSGKNSIHAANEVYTTLSEYFNNDMPEFYFTLQEKKSEKTQIGAGKNTDYIHFLVKETKKGNQVNYRVTEHKIKSDNFKRFKNEVKKLSKKAQMGGHKKHHYDDDDWLFDDDDEDDDDYYFPKMKKSTVLSNPISFWWYDPYF